MIGGRVIWGLAQWILLSIQGNSFTMQAFLAGAFFNAVPGIVLQLIIIPLLVRRLQPMIDK